MSKFLFQQFVTFFIKKQTKNSLIVYFHQLLTDKKARKNNKNK